MSDLDPVLAARVASSAQSRTAHHEAGHAVAAIARGGTLVRVTLGVADWSTTDTAGDVPATTVHRSAEADQPFVTFAGPWATAMWMIHINDDATDEIDDLDEALELAWEDSSDGDSAKYEGVVARLDGVSDAYGLPLGGARPWEWWWREELDDLWPAIRQVAQHLIEHGEVTDERVQAALAEQP